MDLYAKQCNKFGCTKVHFLTEQLDSVLVSTWVCVRVGVGKLWDNGSCGR